MEHECVSRSRYPMRRSRCGHCFRPFALVNSMISSEVTPRFALHSRVSSTQYLIPRLKRVTK